MITTESSSGVKESGAMQIVQVAIWLAVQEFYGLGIEAV